MNELRKALRRVVLASVLVLAVAFLLNQKAYASVKVEGVPSWLSGAMQRSLDAVWNEAARRNLSNKEEILRLVAKGSFRGLSSKASKRTALTFMLLLKFLKKMPLVGRCLLMCLNSLDIFQSFLQRI